MSVALVCELGEITQSMNTVTHKPSILIQRTQVTGIVHKYPAIQQVRISLDIGTVDLNLVRTIAESLASMLEPSVDSVYSCRMGSVISFHPACSSDSPKRASQSLLCGSL